MSIKSPSDIESMSVVGAVESATLRRPLNKSEWAHHTDALSCVLRQGEVVRDILDAGIKNSGRAPIADDVGETRENLRSIAVQKISVEAELTENGFSECKLTVEACDGKPPEMRLSLKTSSSSACRVCAVAQIRDMVSIVAEKCQKKQVKAFDVNSGFDEVYGSESRVHRAGPLPVLPLTPHVPQWAVPD